jgi:hypothetical protein
LHIVQNQVLEPCGRQKRPVDGPQAS